MKRKAQVVEVSRASLEAIQAAEKPAAPVCGVCRKVDAQVGAMCSDCFDREVASTSDEDLEAAADLYDRLVGEDG
jgi:hypothetical protein